MKKILNPIACLVLFLSLFLSGCDETFEDVIPPTFFMIQLNPDDIYLFNGGSEYGTRLDPLLNDSIKVDVTVSYSTPPHGTIRFIENEGWFYKPDAGYYGIDNVTYTVCWKDGCGSASINIFVEQPLDPATCVYAINGEAIEIEKDQAIEIRIFENDVICQYQGMSLFAPEKGTYETFSYSGNYKNTIYVYRPPKGFTGTDRFKYRFVVGNTYMETYCNITIK